MENNDRNLAGWVDQRLAALQPAANFRTNVPKALAQVQERRRAYRVALRRWLWGCAAAAAICLAALIVPMPCSAASSSSCGQPVATRLWDSVFRKPVAPAPAPAAAPITSPVAVPPPVTEPAPAAAPTPRTAPPSAAPAPLFKQSGLPTAPIVCEVYSDYECPSCALAYRDTIPLLEAQYVQTGKVRLVHRDFPLRYHPYSRLAARYANAAGRFGAYNLVVNQLFRTQAEWARTGDMEPQLLQVLSPEVFRKVQGLAKDRHDWDDTVDADLVMALQDGIDRTPSMVVVFGGKRQVISRVPAFPMLKDYLDELLSKR